MPIFTLLFTWQAKMESLSSDLSSMISQKMRLLTKMSRATSWLEMHWKWPLSSSMLKNRLQSVPTCPETTTTGAILSLLLCLIVSKEEERILSQKQRSLIILPLLFLEALFHLSKIWETRLIKLMDLLVSIFWTVWSKTSSSIQIISLMQTDTLSTMMASRQI